MVTFDAATAGTAADVWTQHHRLRKLPPLSLSATKNVVVISAHPDDETLGAGGLIALAGAHKIPLTVIVATDGAASHPQAPTAMKLELRQLRAAELTRAVNILNPAARVLQLGLPDGKTEENRDELRALLQMQLSAMPIGTLVISPWRGDGHRDHRVVGEVSAEAAIAAGFDLIEYPIWMWHWGTPDDATLPWHQMAGLELPDKIRDSKSRAIDEFRSQIQPAFNLPAVLRSDFLKNFRQPTEVFIDSRRASLDALYFEHLYARRADPWHLATRWYETRKRSITVASLPAARYQRGLEIGCSIGMLTQDLALRCDNLLAVDIAEAALESARARLREAHHVVFELLDASTNFPTGYFDLIVLSEVGYYLSALDLTALASAAESHLAPGGVIVLCHWRHPVPEHLLRGDEVHEIIGATTSLSRTVRHEEADFILEIYCAETNSVAQQEGLIP